MQEDTRIKLTGIPCWSRNAVDFPGNRRCSYLLIRQESLDPQTGKSVHTQMEKTITLLPGYPGMKRWRLQNLQGKDYQPYFIGAWSPICSTPGESSQEAILMAPVQFRLEVWRV